MAIVSDVEIRLRADIARLQQDMNAVRRTVDNGMSGVTRAAGLAKAALGGIAAGMSLMSFVKDVVNAQREFDKLNASLVTATGSTAGAAQAFGALQKFAASTPYSVAEATEAFIKLRNLGLTPSEAAMRSYGNTSAAMGKSLNQMIEAVADAATGQFERLKEFGITAKQNGDRVSLTFQGVTKTIGNNSKDIQKYLRDIGDVNFNGAMEARAATLDGAISNLGDTWDSFLRKVSTNGVGNAALQGVLALTGAITDLGAILDVVGGKIHKEGEAVQEASGLHKVLTMTFEAVAAIGVNVAFVFQTIGKDLGTFAAQAMTLFNGGIKGLTDGSTLQAVQAMGKARVEEAEAERVAVDKKTEAILGASAKAQEARDKEEAARKAAGKDELAQYEIVLTAEQKRDKALSDTLDLRNKLNGVDADAAGNLAKLKVALDLGAISQADYNKYTAKIHKDTVMASTAYKDGAKALDMSTEAIKRRAQAQEAANKADQVALDHKKAMGGINEDDYITASANNSIKALEAQKKALQDQQGLLKGRYDTEAARAALLTQMDAKEQEIAAAKIKRDNELDQLDDKRYRDAVNHTADIIESAQQQARAQKDATRDMQDEVDALGLTGMALAEVTAARKRDQAAELDRRANISMIEEETAALRAQADELRKQADLGLTKERVQEQQKFWGDVESTAHEVFLSIGDSSKSLWQRMKDSAKTLFFDWLYSMTLKKWIINIGTSISGDSSVAGLMSNGASSVFGGGGSSAGGSSGSGAMSLISAGEKVYEGFTKGFAGTGAALGGYVSQLGSLFGSSSVSAFGAGMGMTGSQASAAAAAYNGAGMTSTGSAISAGSTAGAAAGVFAGVAGGVYGGRAISGGYGGNGAVNTGTAIGAVVGSIIPVIGTALGALVGGLLGGVYNRMFGYKDKEIKEKGITGDFSAAGFSGDSFANWTQKGGWFRSDKHGTDTAALDDPTQKAFADGFALLKSTTMDFAKTLGLTSEAIDNYSHKINVTLTGDATKDQQIITDMFTAMGDELATRLVPNIAQFAKDGEVASVTLQRLSTDFKAVDAVMSTMGRTFGSVGVASVEARERLINLSGGVEAFGSQASYFLQNFYSDVDKAVMVQKPMQAQMEALGFASVQTTAQFKDAVLALDLTTEKGAQQYAMLMAIAPQFKQVADYITQVNAATEQAAKDAAAALEERRTANRDFLGGLMDDSLAAVGRAVDAQKTAITKAFDASMKAFDASIATVNATISRTSELSAALKTGIKASPGDDGGGSEQAARAQILAALAIAKASGVLPKQEDLAAALSTVQQDSSDNYTTLAEYQRAVAQTNSALEALGGLTDDQLSTAQSQLKALNDAKDAAQVQHDEDLARLDAIMERAQAQVDAVNGVNTSVLSVAAAVAALQTIIGAIKASPAPATNTSASTAGILANGPVTIEELYKQVLGRNADAGGLDFWKKSFGGDIVSSQDQYLDFVKGAKEELSNLSKAPPVVAPVSSGTMSKESAMQSALDTIASHMANVATNTGTTATATNQFAQQFHQVSAGGNALATEAV